MPDGSASQSTRTSNLQVVILRLVAAMFLKLYMTSMGGFMVWTANTCIDLHKVWTLLGSGPHSGAEPPDSIATDNSASKLSGRPSGCSIEAGVSVAMPSGCCGGQPLVLASEQDCLQ